MKTLLSLLALVACSGCGVQVDDAALGRAFFYAGGGGQAPAPQVVYEAPRPAPVPQLAPVAPLYVAPVSCRSVCVRGFCSTYCQ